MKISAMESDWSIRSLRRLKTTWPRMKWRVTEDRQQMFTKQKRKRKICAWRK